MTGIAFLTLACQVALGILTVALLLTIIRIVRGPTLPDRVLGLDMLVAVVVGYIAVIGIYTGYPLYLDVAIALALVGFLSTVALARYVLQRWAVGHDIRSPRSEEPRT